MPIKVQVIIYGAGKAGRQLASIYCIITNINYFFIDDNKSFWGGTIDGYPVNPPSSLDKLENSKVLRELWLALPELSVVKEKN